MSCFGVVTSITDKVLYAIHETLDDKKTFLRSNCYFAILRIYELYIQAVTFQYKADSLPL